MSVFSNASSGDLTWSVVGGSRARYARLVGKEFYQPPCSSHDSLGRARRRLERLNAERLALSTSPSALVREPCNGTHNACDRSHPTCLCGGPDHFASVFPTDCGHITTFMQCQEDAPLLETLSIRIFHSMEEDTYSSPPLPLFK